MHLNHITDNLTPHERLALRNLKKRQDIIIKPADKGSGTVVMDKTCTWTNVIDNLMTLNSTEDKTKT